MQAYVRAEASFVSDVLCHTAGVVYKAVIARKPHTPNTDGWI